MSIRNSQGVHPPRRAIRNGVFALAVALSAGLIVPAPAAPPSAVPPSLSGAMQGAMDKAFAFLAASQQRDGGWLGSGRSDPAVTALVVTAFIHSPAHGVDDPVVKRGLDFILRFAHPDGGIYTEGEGLRNYHTSVCLSALAAADERLAGDPRYREPIRKAQEYLKKMQWDEDKDHDRSSSWYGGAGYGTNKRPDLSNTQMMVEALHDSGLSKNDPAYKKAIEFISRCQMLSETNDQPFARGSVDGGFIYSPVKDGESKAGTEIIEGKPRLRSYGTMTYAGFKSFLYAGVSRDDSRVKACIEWIKRHYTLDSNPNMPDRQVNEGLFYYYHVFAKALAVWGDDIITDSRGEKHNWRVDLCLKLKGLQHEDGSWTNKADRWMEDNPYLVTAYSLRALQTALGQ
jgi:squalene-hopene/tetraprenyl-beta-curcumene cyclase